MQRVLTLAIDAGIGQNPHVLSIEGSVGVHFVLLGTHNAEVCPTSNSKTRDLMLQTASEVPAVAERAGVKIVAGPYVNHEHLTVAVVEADKAENVDQFIMGTRLNQWNAVRVLPSRPIEEGIKEVQESTPLF
jgi:hypothetical protein